MNGIINLLKPPGMTSSDAVVCIRKLYNIKKAGHMGTLDPDASGVLPIGLGSATRLFDYTADLTKTYLAALRLGIATDTMDASGKIVYRGENMPQTEAIKSVLPAFTGPISQIPPMYSAVKQNGVRLYKLARADKTVERSAREVVIASLDYIKQIDTYTHLIKIECSKGTYIRSLCDDIGQALGCGAYMRFLIRTDSSGLGIGQSYTLDEIKELAANKEEGKCVLPPESILKHFDRYDAPSEYRLRLFNGARMPYIGSTGTSIVRVYMDDAFYGLANIGENTIKMRVQLRGVEGQWL